jgi:thiol-disulfide isomerase/thioredoxin
VTSKAAPEVRGTFLCKLSLLILSGVIAGQLLTSARASDYGTLQPWDGPDELSLELQDLSKNRLTLSEYSGRPVIVHFFATWCAPCLRELPALAEFAKRHDPQDLTVLTVDVGEPDIRVKRFFETMLIPFPVLLDRDRSTARAWGVYSLPMTVMLDEELTPRFSVEGEFDWSQDAAVELPLSLTSANLKKEERQLGKSEDN